MDFELHVTLCGDSETKILNQVKRQGPSAECKMGFGHRSRWSLLALTLILCSNSVSAVTPTFAPPPALCGYPGAPAHSTLTFSGPELLAGVVATYACERGFELLGPARRVCGDEGKWTPEGIPFCVLNVAAGKAPMQSSVAGSGVPQKAVDGSPANFFNPATCTLTQPERAPWWYVNLLEPYMVQLVRLDFGRPCCGDQTATIVVRVGNNRPDLGVNPICNKFNGLIEEGKPLFLPCNPPIAGAFVSVQLEGPPGNALSICESFVYTDQALPIERCPQFRDQPPGSTATYNGKCYIFYNQQMLRFEEARQFCAARGGSLVDDSNPALQGFLSWEMWRRHRSDPSAQYWLGAVRDSKDLNNWKWLNGKDVTVSFWNLPGGRGNCARFDGSKGWLWSDTNCNDAHNFICQHGPKGCGRPEQPPNSTLLATSLDVGARIEHRCDTGSLLVGPSTRTCLPNGFYSDFPPICRYLECGLPAQVPNGQYTLINGTRAFQSMVHYTCEEGYVMVGRNDLICDIDQKWNGPPPRCEALICPEPPQILHGYFTIIAREENSYTVLYECNPRYTLHGPKQLTCAEGVYDQLPPVCREVPMVPASGLGIPSSSTNKPVPPISSVRPFSPSSTPKATTHAPVTVTSVTYHETVEEGEEFAGEDGFDENQVDEQGHEDDDDHQLRPVGSSSAKPPAILGGDKKSGSGIMKDPIDNNIAANEGAESINVDVIHRGSNQHNADIPRNSIHNHPKGAGILNMAGIIALCVFGGVILLAAIVTSVVLLVRRSQGKRKHERHRGSPDSHTITSVDSGSDAGLGRLYRRAWDSLAATGGPPTGSTTVSKSVNGGSHHHIHGGKIPKDTLDFRSRLSSVEGLRDDGEIIVHDALPRKHHHHHHHGMHHHHNNGGGMHDGTSLEWGRSVRSHRSRY